jgi:amphi-Trp domain-containing protein
MNTGSRLGSDPLDWIGVAPDASEESGSSGPDAKVPPSGGLWRAMRPKGDRKEFKAELNEHLDRERVADMLEALAGFVRAGSVPLGDGERAAVLSVGADLDVEAAVSLKKEKAKLQIEMEWRNR